MECEKLSSKKFYGRVPTWPQFSSVHNIMRSPEVRPRRIPSVEFIFDKSFLQSIFSKENGGNMQQSAITASSISSSFFSDGRKQHNHDILYTSTICSCHWFFTI
eukprot:5437128-Ditylum_brightwellii.AAC.1